MNKRLIGFMLIAIGIGIILTLIISEEVWTILVASLTIILGLILLRC